MNVNDIRPAPQQAAWQDLEFGAVLHYGLHTFLGQEWADGSADPSVFQPSDLNAEQWVTTAKAAGARYVILNARNQDGFCLWPSKHSAYTVKATPWRNGQGDLVREVANACRKHDLKFGLSLPADAKTPEAQHRLQLEELASTYGDLVEFWADGASAADVNLLRQHQPNALLFGGLRPDIRRLPGDGGVAPEENWHANGAQWLPAAAVVPLREKHWFWHPNAEPRVMAGDKLLDLYHRTVGHGYQLVLGLAPDRRGLIADADLQTLRAFGDQVKRMYGQNLIPLASPWAVEGGPSPRGALDSDPKTFWMAHPDRRTASINLVYKTPVTFDRVVLMEWLNDGQKIYRYQIEAKYKGKWSKLLEGTTVGHKRIDRVPIQTASEFRLTVDTMSGPPALREFQIHNGGGL